MLKITTPFDNKLNEAGIYYNFFGKEIVDSKHSYFSRFKDNERIKNISDEDILNSRNKILHELEIDDLSILRQIHSDIAVNVNQILELNNEIEADGQVTKQKNLALGICTADCTPILFADVNNKVIGAAHAGWRGAFDGIIESTIKELKTQGAEEIIAIIGPTIAQDSYEISQEFFDRFIIADAANKIFFRNGKREGHYYFNLPAFVTDKLNKTGIKEIYDVNLDTLTNEQLFHSFRRATLSNVPLEGGNLSTIMIKK